ncbi:MAG TPA: hypothetical protein PK918_08695 [Methanotrichaceae archaeon]|nr:hypothetical protein [Methanotrichaceae archaeon]
MRSDVLNIFAAANWQAKKRSLVPGGLAKAIYTVLSPEAPGFICNFVYEHGRQRPEKDLLQGLVALYFLNSV